MDDKRYYVNGVQDVIANNETLSAFTFVQGENHENER